MERLEPQLREVVGERNLLHTDEVALGHTCRGVVVGIVECGHIGVLRHLTLGENDGNVGAQLVTRYDPAVLELLRHCVEVGVVRLE